MTPAGQIASPNWETVVGRHPVRASCWACGETLLLDQTHEQAFGVCPNLCCTVELCLDRYMWKFCCREKGHESVHLSASGTAWAKVVRLGP